MDRLNREIFRLSLPTIVSNITIPLLGICDTAISGHLGSELFLSAIAIGTVMLNVVFWIFGFLRGGTTGLTANALGACDNDEISKVFYRGTTIALSAGLLLIILQNLIFDGLWLIAGGSEDIKSLVKEYFTIRIWGSPALLLIIAISGWFVGMQTTFYPMLIAIITNILNIGMSYILAFPLGFGFKGVALGTLAANWFGLLVSIVCILYFLKGRMLKCSWSNLMRGNWWRYFSVNGNLFLRSFFIICVTMGVTAAGARLGNLTLAINIIVMQFFQFFSFFIDGFAYSGEAMVGLRFGENNYAGMASCVKRLLLWTGATGLLFSLIYLAGTDYFTSLLTDSDNVINGVSELTVWIALIPIVSCWAFIFDGFYVGITDTFKMMISSLIGGLIFFGLLSLNFIDNEILSEVYGNKVIWSAFLSYLLSRGIYLGAMWKSSIRQRFKGVIPRLTCL